MSRPARFPLQQGRVPPKMSLEGDPSLRLKNSSARDDPDGKALALMSNLVVHDFSVNRSALDSLP
jgi:hypothetical protein